MSRAQSGGDGGVSLTTLVISSGSAVVATVVVPLFWQKGHADRRRYQRSKRSPPAGDRSAH